MATWARAFPNDQGHLVSRVGTSLSEDDGFHWTNPQPHVTDPSIHRGVPTDPQVFTDKAGTWFVTWYDDMSLDLVHEYDIEVHAIRSVDNGATWEPAFRLNADGDVDNRNDFHPRMTSPAPGVWIAAWAGQPNDLMTRQMGDLLVSRSTDNGGTWSTPTSIYPSGEQFLVGGDGFPSLVSDDTGASMLVWGSGKDLGVLGGDTDVLFSLSSDAGLTWSPPAPVNSNAVSDDTYDGEPQIATDGLGNWVAVWRSLNTVNSPPGEPLGIHWAWSGDGGGSWSDPQAFTVPSCSSETQMHEPRMAGDGHNGFAAMWYGYTCDNAPQMGWDVFVTHSPHAGGEWTTPRRIRFVFPDEPRSDIRPHIASDGAGLWVASWTSAPEASSEFGEDSEVMFSVGSFLPTGLSLIEYADTQNAASPTFHR